MGLMRAYRATGADLPFGDPGLAHGVAMEGYFWRVSDPATGRVLICLIGVNRGPDGPWATLGVAASESPEVPATLITGAYAGAEANRDRLGARSGGLFAGDAAGVRVSLEGAEVGFAIDEPVRWPHRLWGGSSLFQAVLALNQYWHPWLLGGRATGYAELGGERWEFVDAQVYGEKNWGRGGFPDAWWWWGQAQGFADPGACVAFAGGQVYAGPLRTEVTGLVVRLPDGRVIRLGNPVVSPVSASVDDESWTLRGRGYGWTIEVDAVSPREAAHVLPVPLPAQGRNTAGALEHLTGRLSVRVRRGGRLIWQGLSEVAGLELGGLERARAELVRRGIDPEAEGARPVG